MSSEHYLNTARARKTGNIDYDLYVIHPNNEDTTPEQLRDCLYDALEKLEERIKELEKKNETI